MKALRNLRILLVDDEPELREALTQMLGFLGHEVTCAGTAEAALEAFDARTQPLDVLITDFSMPGIGGAGLVRAIRERAQSLPVVVFSGLDESMVKSILRQERNVGFLKKPFTLKILAESIERQINLMA